MEHVAENPEVNTSDSNVGLAQVVQPNDRLNSRVLTMASLLESQPPEVAEAAPAPKRKKTTATRAEIEREGLACIATLELCTATLERLSLVSAEIQGLTPAARSSASAR